MPGMPNPFTDETDQLLAYVAQQRYAIRLTAHDLTREQVTATPTRSTLSIAGLIKHTVLCERGWVTMASGRVVDGQQDYMSQFSLADDETLDDLVALQAEVAVETERNVRELGLQHRFPNPKGVPWFPEDVDEWDVRWMLMHLVEEVARHAGHADIIREHVDGRQMGDITAEVEGWVLPDWAQ